MIEKIEVLKGYAIDDFSRRCLAGAAGVLKDEANPLRVNLFSTAMRMFYGIWPAPSHPETMSWRRLGSRQ